jgi:hypothetical protein
MLKKRKKLKGLKVTKLRGGGMDMGSAASQAKSASMAGSSSTTSSSGRDPSAQFKDSTPISSQARQDLATQRKTARETISPSTKTSSQIGAAIASGLASTIIPGSGAFVRRAMLNKMDETPYWSRDKKQKTTMPPIGGDRDGGGNNQPLILPTTANVAQSEIPIPRRKVEPYPIKINFNKGGLSGGVRSGPPPKRGPNPQGLKNGGMTCPHRPDGIRGYGAAIKGFKFTGVK